ncbi:MAG: DNA mismatch repair protein MutT [Nitrososphaera sp.]|nr:DNA mismatch repair protein MutT [Nitrososphaera sp.]
MLDGLVKNRVDLKKPRKEGLTCTIDKLQSVDRENFSILAPYVDIVKIYGAFPLLASEQALKKKIRFYQDFGIKVSTGSTITEFAIIENSFDRFVNEAASLGFDIIEVGENSIDLSLDQKKKIVEIIKTADIDLHWKVGKKDPRHQLGIDKTLQKIDEAVKQNAKKVVLEANEGINVGIFDEKGLVKWSFVGAITNEYPPSTFIFEAPFESQQSALIAEFGQRVNLAEIHQDSIASVESQRRGFLSKSAFGVSYIRRNPEGGPASKFIYYIIKTKHPIEQGELMTMSHLPRRTVQAAVEDLKRQGLVIERSSLEDARKKVYLPVQSDWL